MAAIVRYVNTNSTAGGDGTTDAITGVNRAYSSQNEMEAAEQTNLVTAGDTFTGICAGDLDSADVVYSGWTTDATHDILITTTTDRHNGVFDNTKYYMNIGTSSLSHLTVLEEYFSVKGLQFERDSLVASSAPRYCISAPVGTGSGLIKIEQNIFKSIASDITGAVAAFDASDSSPNYHFKNNICYNFNGSNDYGIGGSGSGANIDIYNNTFINCTNGVFSQSGYTCKNNIFQDCTNDINGTLNANNDYNLTDNVSIAGANSVTSSTLSFENKAANNYALAAGDTDAIGAGIGPSSDANVPNVDVIGTARTGAATDIGAYVFVGGGGVTLLVDSGTYNLTGNDISLKAAFKSAIGNGAYNLTGTATGLLVERKLSIDIGSYSLTGQSVNFSTSYSLISGIGSYALSGNEVDLKAARKVITDNGAYNLTGSSVELIYTPAGGGDILVIDSGSFVLNGADVGLVVSRRSTIESGNYNLTGQSIQLTYNSKIVTDNGDYALTGQDISLFASYVTIATSGSYDLTGYSVTLKYSGDTNQTIGTVTASFADDKFTASYKPNSITVNFKA
tara:strand:- start:7768 stop:9459 length:1692 start_codon:yes stop_codon:yes gene_type:complete